MIPVKIETLVMGMLPCPSVIILRPSEVHEEPGMPVEVLPIWIGATEAMAIGTALEGARHPRPMTHDLLVSVIEALGAEVERVEINDVRRTTFFAKIHLVREDRRFVVDSRPSDAIAVAVRVNAPIYVDDSVFGVASFPLIEQDRESLEQELNEFHHFLENVTPDDFAEADQIISTGRPLQEADSPSEALEDDAGKEAGNDSGDDAEACFE